MIANKKRLLVFFFTLSAFAIVCFQFIVNDDKYETLEGEIFSTHYKVTYKSTNSLKLNPDEIQSAIEKELNRIDLIASSWKSESELSRYNQAANKEEFILSKDLKFLLEHSEEIKQLTNGAFDIEYKKGQLDLSAIAKGYAVDCIARYLQDELGIQSFLVDIGGEIKAKGTNSMGKSWSVGIFIPPGFPACESIKSPRILLNETSIATSGRYFKGSHIIDPKSGKAVSNSLVSMSVIHPSCSTADALVTALFVMGSNKGIAWAREHKIHAIAIDEDGSILRSYP